MYGSRNGVVHDKDLVVLHFSCIIKDSIFTDDKSCIGSTLPKITLPRRMRNVW